MQKEGPVYPGTEHGDFNVNAKDGSGVGARGEGPREMAELSQERE